MPKLLNPRQSRVVLGLCSVLVSFFCQHFAVDLRAQSDALIIFDREARTDPQGHKWLSWSTENIGHRLTGSPGGARAERFADSLFRSIPADTSFLWPFSAQAWTREAVSLTLSAHGKSRSVDAVSLANTPLDISITAPLADLGNGFSADIARLGDAVSGKIVLINLGLIKAAESTKNLHRTEKTSLAIAAGVGGIIFVNQAFGHVLLTGTASIDGSLIGVPAVCISAEEGEAIREQMMDGTELEASLKMTNSSAMVTANNVIAEIRGSDFPEEVILVGGHLDSWDLATGATDNGLGAFSILDLARALKHSDQRPRRTIRFVLFMGEEQGLLGSRALVKEYQRTNELKNIRCMINLDMSGNPHGFGVGGPAGWAATISEMNRAILANDTIDFKGEVTEKIWLHSDHQPFLLANVPVLYPICDLGKDVYGCYHSSCDDIHLVDPKAMVNNVRFVGMLVLQLADANDLPAHFNRDELRERLIEAELEEPLRIAGDLPW